MRELASPAVRAKADPLAAWAERNIRLAERPFSFAGHEYLRDIYDDTSPHVVLCKAAQIGGTTWSILRSIHACLNGLDVVYFFPTKSDVLEFSKSRVGPLLADNPDIMRMVSDTDTAGLKRIGPAHLFFRGMRSTGQMKSVPADMIVFDELDEASPEARTLALERLAHSTYKRIIELSNPSLPGYGIDVPFQESDQRHWTLKCPACGQWTALDKKFPRKLGQEVKIILPWMGGGFFRACPKCGGELDLAAGEWVADFPGRLIHGYLISQLLSTRVDPGEILRGYRTTRFPQRFYNLNIGVPYADREHGVDAALVLSLCGEEPIRDKDPGPCSMGIDTGKDLHVVVLKRLSGENRFQIIQIGICGSFEELDGYIDRFNVDRCVIDGLPEVHATRAFARRHRNVVGMSYFNEHQRGEAKWDHDAQTVSMNRVEALDASREIIRGKQVVLPRQSRLVEEFAVHMAADVKILQEDEQTGVQRYKYLRKGANHFSLALTYALMAANDYSGGRGLLEYMRRRAAEIRGEA